MEKVGGSNPSSLICILRVMHKTFESKEDDSVNFVFEGDYPGYLEARYVRRSPKYFAAYLSSQSGCAQACRMCHLTATKQIKNKSSTLTDYNNQARTVLDWYDTKCPKAEIVHYNFMARGEAFDNPEFIEYNQDLFTRLGLESTKRKLFPRFLVSTILPVTLKGKSLSEIFPVINPEIYYSIYSVNPEFRKRWIPKALPVDKSLAMLKEYQDNTKKIIKLHWAFIEGQNDSEDDMALLCHRVRSSGLRVDIAIVRYNPYSDKFGAESSLEVINRNVEILKMLLPFSKVKMITRVGPDVKASCGMFVEPE